MPLFFFGTLMDRDILSTAIGRDAGALRLGTASIGGFARRRVWGESFPMLVPEAGGRVDGLLAEDLSETDVDRLQFFEGSSYRLKRLAVQTAQGRRPARLFVDDPEGDVPLVDSGEPWDFAAWQRHDKPLALLDAAAMMAHYRVTPLAEVEAMWHEITERTRACLAAASSPDMPSGLWPSSPWQLSTAG